jgi:hypothetical protein
VSQTISQPSIVKLGDKQHGVSFTASWKNVVASLQQLGPLQFNGVSFSINPSSVNSAFQNFQAKSMQIFCQFYNAGADPVLDGPFFIYSQASQQIITIANPVVPVAFTAINDFGTIPDSLPTVTAVVPIVAGIGSNIVIGKDHIGLDNIVNGFIAATIFDFEVPPYYGVGLTQSSSFIPST